MPVRGKFESAIITDVDLPIRPNGCAVGSATGFGYDFFRSVGSHAGERAARDLDHQYTAVVQGNRAFGESQSRGDFSHLWHMYVSFFFPSRIELLISTCGCFPRGCRSSTEDSGHLHGARITNSLVPSQSRSI